MPGVARKPGVWAVLLLFALVYAPTAVWFVDRWSMGIWWHVHGFLVFPLAIWLAWSRLRACEEVPASARGRARRRQARKADEPYQRRDTARRPDEASRRRSRPKPAGISSQALKSLPPEPPSSSAWGFAFLVPAALLQVLDAMLGFEILSAVSMLLAICGLALLLLGRKRAKAIWFPLLFLGFAVPIPLFVARPIHLALRSIAAASTEGVLGGLGYDVHREGFNLSVGPEKLEVADACSGFSALMAMLMVGLLLAYLSKARAWRGGLLVLWVIPAAIAANVARCILLSMLIAAFGGGILHTAVHPISGIFTFVAALVLVLALDRVLLIPPKPEVAPC